MWYIKRNIKAFLEHTTSPTNIPSGTTLLLKRFEPDIMQAAVNMQN